MNSSEIKGFSCVGRRNSLKAVNENDALNFLIYVISGERKPVFGAP